MTDTDRVRGTARQADDHERVRALHRYALLDSARDPAYDALVERAAHICGTPISAVSFVDADRHLRLEDDTGLPEGGDGSPGPQPR